ncbi:hypothetical protein BZA05DRAFT_353378 [Tricharina praecox]|uniref:uncharacterized protein n=1 Tax=Tricharina praecox TaxID=43433 RepID=UPI002220E16C|nr:uncharacterized protein BZA05DRAFT_353378 [Tricharina praecox]KAI5851812.1 hypothetical protein BZA05DRAFT_353378 [Tricharina praecox]
MGWLRKLRGSKKRGDHDCEQLGDQEHSLDSASSDVRGEGPGGAQVAPLEDTPISSEEHQSIMKELYISSHATQHSRYTPRAPRTCEWLLRHQTFQAWKRQRQSSSLLWLSGYPGSGKSTLAAFLIDELQQTVPGGGDAAETVCYFFFQDSDSQQRSADRAMCAVLHQLFTANPRLSRHAALQGQDRNRSGRFPREFAALWNVLLDAVNDPLCGDVLCVLDGLDECEEASQTELIEALVKWYTIATAATAGPGSLKFLLTSRPSRTIERHFFSFPKIRLKAEVESTRKDIAALIRCRMEGVPEFRGPGLGLDDASRTEIEDKLVRNAQGNFLWVDLVLGLIADSARESAEALRAIVDKPPATLDAVYERILSSSSNAAATRRLLHIISAAKRPLSLEELHAAFTTTQPSDRAPALSPHTSPPHAIQIRQLCSHFILIIDSRVHLIHHTAKDFLCHPVATISPAQTQGVWKHSFHPVESHRILTLVCVSILGSEDTENTEDTEHENEIEKRPLMDYAHRYWREHARLANPEDDEMLLGAIKRLGRG